MPRSIAVLVDVLEDRRDHLRVRHMLDLHRTAVRSRVRDLGLVRELAASSVSEDPCSGVPIDERVPTDVSEDLDGPLVRRGPECLDELDVREEVDLDLVVLALVDRGLPLSEDPLALPDPPVRDPRSIPAAAHVATIVAPFATARTMISRA